MMDVRKDHVKFWRPQILYACGNPRYNCVLIDFINALKKSGLYIIGHVRVDDFDQVEARSDPRWSPCGFKFLNLEIMFSEKDGHFFLKISFISWSF